MINALEFYQTSINPLVRIAILFVVVLILWRGLRRAGLTPKAWITGLLITAVSLVWWVASDLLGDPAFTHRIGTSFGRWAG